MKHTFIIAEAGVNHNGKLDLALKLCDSAKKSGVNAIKFQTWKTENIVTMTTNLASYQESSISNGEISQFEMLKKLELSYHDFITIKDYCDKIGIIFLSTPDDSESLVFLMKLGINFIKVGSGEVNNTPFLREIGSTKMPVVLSTGMSNLGEVERAYNILIEAGTPKISLLHCTTNYPCPMDEVNLTAMVSLRDAFKCKVGYSDHTEGIEISIAAVALGAEIIEKHFTLDKSMEGPDHKASLDPMELAEMVKAIRNIEKAMGNGVKKANKSEKEIEKVIKKKIVASKNISKGEIFSNLNITVKRSDIGLSAEFWDLIQGRESNLNYEIDQPIEL
jgi:N-acetylneuraminate synthase/N,N'-diacetyllegionaminate synthase